MPHGHSARRRRTRRTLLLTTALGLLAACAAPVTPGRPVTMAPVTVETLGPQRPAAWAAAILAPLDLDGATVRVAVAAPALDDAARRAIAGHGGLRRLLAAVDAVVADPTDAAALGELGAALQALGQNERARVAFTTALRADPQLLAARRGLARSLARLGRHEAARREWRAVAVADDGADDGEAWRAIAVASHYLGDAATAADALERARAAGAPTPTALAALVRHGDAPQAMTAAVTAGAFALGEEVRVDAGGATEATETSVAIAGDRLVAGWNDLREANGKGWWRLGAGVSTDGGATWSDRILRPAGTGPDVHEGDPIAAVDPRTGDLWLAGMVFGAQSLVYVSRLAADGTLTAPVIAGRGAWLDRPWLVAGPLPGFPGVTRLYVSYSEAGLGTLRTSDDGGATWQTRTPFPTGAPHFTRVDAAGRLHACHNSQDIATYRCVESADGGQTYSPVRDVAVRLDVWDFPDGSRFPGRFRVPPIPTLAVAPDGWRYLLWSDTTRTVGGDADVDVYLVRSADGVTWTAPTVVAGGAQVAGDQFLPWLEIDRHGRLHLVYFDTRRTPQVDGQVDAQVDVVYARSDDGGASWREVFVTDRPLSSADAVWPSYGFDQFVGDFLSLAVADDGEAVTVLYPTTRDGDLDIVARRIVALGLLVDGFESGDTAAWSAAVGD